MQVTMTMTNACSAYLPAYFLCGPAAVLVASTACPNPHRMADLSISYFLLYCNLSARFMCYTCVGIT